MLLTKFLIIDLTLILIGLPIILILQGGINKPSIFKHGNESNLPDKSSINIPSISELLELEITARSKGSGIEYSSLIGLWKFVSVWKPGTDNEDSIASSLLRLFSASLELRENQTDKDCSKFDIINSIQFGSLSIRFIGYGNLKGSQPLLPFFFENIELRLGENVLLSRSLDIPNEKDKPFFALISMQEEGKWLSARGRGGGLALWLKD